jgi:hypothetical protein
MSENLNESTSEKVSETPPAERTGAPVVSRRTALKVLGAVPIAGALGSSIALGQQAATQQQPKQTHEAPNQPAQGQGTPASSAPRRQFFTAKEFRTVEVLADDIIPADGRSSGAVAAGVPAFIDFHMSVPETSEDTRTAMRGGLRWLDTQSRKRFGTPYATTKTAQRHQILDDISWPAKARPEMSQGVAFFNRFRDMVGSGFFSSPTGWRDLQYVGNVFNPGWHGCPEPAMRKLGVSLALMDTRVKPQ